ncbi:MAG TPA: LysM peptidoglycan-binding domain-containing protein [Ignavibacteriaceae bacterium]|nr:LysM peptidoglycan-binding domain-containing protein [Ignavibacteriaceae bacterium]
MKLNKYLIGVFTLLLFFSVNMFAQDEDMTEEQWQTEMTSLRAQKESLTKELSALQTEISNLKATNIQSYDDCISELYAMVGATRADVDNFRRAVNELKSKIDSKESPKADRQKDLDALKMNKISALPEFYETVHITLQRALDSWMEEPMEVDYTVVRGDCLWNIAKKNEFYGNGFAWPNIYKANRDKIKDPDLIYPKQVFKIPKLTDEEKAKYDKIRRNYKPAPIQ